MVRMGKVRELLRQAEGFFHAGDAYGAVARARYAERQAASMASPEGDDVPEEVRLVLDRLEPAEAAAREIVKRRHALHVANERLAAGIEDVALDPPPTTRSGIAGLLRGTARRLRPDPAGRPAWRSG